MPLVLGLDLGTTTITSLVVDTDTGDIVARTSLDNAKDAGTRRSRLEGYAEWDIANISYEAIRCVKATTDQLSRDSGEYAGLALTGQQHGMVILGQGELQPCVPFINWQDRRGEKTFRGDQTFTERAQELIGDKACFRTGCRLATGYGGVTLFWLWRRNRKYAAGVRACFLSDRIAARLIEAKVVTDPTLAASSGLFDVASSAWAWDLIEQLKLPPDLFPPVKPVGKLLGRMKAYPGRATGLPKGLPVFNGLGDNQAGFLGSVASPDDSILVNVGTGGQVSAYLPEFLYDPALETRPFPDGFLLVCAGLTGGRVYAVLHNFFKQIGRDLFGHGDEASVYEAMNRLAATVPPGCDGLRCEPYFSGTRQQPELRGSWTGVSTTNFTPAHMTRALLEGMARCFKEGFDRMTPHLRGKRRHLIAAGNGMRENPLLRQLVGEAFGLKVLVPRHREEAAYGAALTAAVGAGIFPDFRTAAKKLIRYEQG